jgi:hypothetical protein
MAGASGAFGTAGAAGAAGAFGMVTFGVAGTVGAAFLSSQPATIITPATTRERAINFFMFLPFAFCFLDKQSQPLTLALHEHYHMTSKTQLFFADCAEYSSFFRIGRIGNNLYGI